LTGSRRAGMTTTQQVQQVLQNLPDDCSLDDVLYHLYVLQSVESGRADYAAGRRISHEQVAREMQEKWVLGAEK
jgi:hypothetical protein